MKKRPVAKDKKVKQLLKKGGRKGAEKDFLELVRRASITISKRS
jgi:hypothetical protein